MATPDFARMPLDELRTWTARRIAESMPRVRHARGEKDEATKVLTLWITWAEATTNFQKVLPERMMQSALDRWVWEGWTVKIMPELAWKERRGAVVDPPRKKVPQSEKAVDKRREKARR